jgi:hypothetical protein
MDIKKGLTAVYPRALPSAKCIDRKISTSDDTARFSVGLSLERYSTISGLEARD